MWDAIRHVWCIFTTRKKEVTLARGDCYDWSNLRKSCGIWTKLQGCAKVTEIDWICVNCCDRNIATSWRDWQVTQIFFIISHLIQGNQIGVTVTAWYSANTLTFKSACLSGESGSKYVQHDGNNPPIECDCGQEEPTDSVSDFLSDKASVCLLDQGTVVFLCVCFSVWPLRTSVAVIRNQPWFLQRKEDVHWKQHTDNSCSHTTWEQRLGQLAGRN